MLQSYLFLTQSYLENQKLQKEIGWQFFVQKKLGFNSGLNSDLETKTEPTKTLENQKKLGLYAQNSQIKDSLALENLEKNSENIEKIWQKFQNLVRIITTVFDDKRDARVQIMSFYQNYSEPTLLFLGNLQDYSTALQESLLKFLEEPPSNLFVILFAHNSSQILGTISSRCLKIIVPTPFVFQFLDPVLAASVKEKLPSPSAICADLVKNKISALPDLKKVERAELDLWLWQIEKCLENLWLQEMSKNNSKLITKISTLLTKTLQTRQLNNQNLQKKLALGHLFLTTSA